MTLSAEFILVTFIIGELVSIGNDVNNQSKSTKTSNKNDRKWLKQPNR